MQKKLLSFTVALIMALGVFSFTVATAETPAIQAGTSQPAYLGDVFYKGIEISRILDEQPKTTLGMPINSRGPYYFYDGLEIYYTNYVDAIQCTNLSLCTIDGITLDKTRTELIAAFGNPIEYYKYPDYAYRDSDDARTMRYHVSSFIMDYMLEFWFENLGDKASIIRISRIGQ